jgi:antirestriction protein ArdC
LHLETNMSNSNPMHRSSHTTVSHPDLYAEVTQQIIAALEAGTPPWVCPWDKAHASLLPANLSTGRPYRGINILLLNLRQMAAGYPSPRWLTFQQAHSLGAKVRKGERGTKIVFFKLLERDPAGAECGDAESGFARAANDDPPRRVIPLLKSFTVFNEAQVDDLPADLTWPESPGREFNACDVADDLLTQSGALFQQGGSQAYYSPSQDLIQMPPREVFHDDVGFYNTALHELTHWTGHPSRCARTLSSRQHIDAYAFEELVAEMGSAFLSSRCGLPAQLNHASYIQSWLLALRDDKRLIFAAASLAQKAVDYLLPEQNQMPTQTPSKEVAA